MVAEFIADHVDRNKVAPDRFTALAYDAFGLLSEALEVAGSLNGRRVRDALVNMKETDGVTGASRLAPDGTPIKHPHLYRVDSDNSGEKFVLVLDNGE
jgi:branched-chain amino acid transport system substrate-binding protein